MQRNPTTATSTTVTRGGGRGGEEQQLVRELEQLNNDGIRQHLYRFEFEQASQVFSQAMRKINTHLTSVHTMETEQTRGWMRNVRLELIVSQPIIRSDAAQSGGRAQQHQQDHQDHQQQDHQEPNHLPPPDFDDEETNDVRENYLQIYSKACFFRFHFEPSREQQQDQDQQQDEDQSQDDTSTVLMGRISAIILYNTSLALHLRGRQQEYWEQQQLYPSYEAHLMPDPAERHGNRHSVSYYYQRSLRLYQVVMELVANFAEPFPEENGDNNNQDNPARQQDPQDGNPLPLAPPRLTQESRDLVRLLALSTNNNCAHIYNYYASADNFALSLQAMRMALSFGDPSPEDAHFEMNLILSRNQRPAATA